MNSPLKEKVYVVDTSFFDVKLRRGITVVDMFLKEDVTSAIKLYKKYHNNYEKFIKDYPDVIEGKDYLWLNQYNFDNTDDRNNEFNCFLFDYCFGDVIDE